MEPLTIAGLILGAGWGLTWALFLERAKIGIFIRVRLTWLSVVIGIGVDLLIAMLVIDFEAWWRFTAIIAMSSIAIIWRSLSHDSNDHFTMIGPKHDDSNQSGN